MKIVCENCSAKYSIADEKVKGKVFKIRCKKCGESIVVRGDSAEGAAERASAPPPMPAAPPAMDEEADAETKVFDYSGYQSDSQDAPVWHIVVDGQQQGPYTNGQIREYLAAGSLDAETFIWREGFTDWLPIREVKELSGKPAPTPASLFGGGGGMAAPKEPAPAASGGLFDAEPASPFGGGSGGGGLFDQPASGGLFSAPGPEPASPFDSGGGGLFGGAAAVASATEDVFASTPASGGLFGGGAAAQAQAPAKSAKPAAAATRGGMAAPDLFRGGDDGGDGLFSSADAPDQGPRVGAAQIMMTGQRNENSVLFSLSNLQALAAQPAAAAPMSSGIAAPAATSEASGLIDIRSLASSLSHEKESGLDDLISLGGAGFAPSLGAPVLAVQREGLGLGAKIGIAAGAVALVAAIAVVLVLVLTGGEKKPEDAVRDQQIITLMKQLEEMKKKGGSGAEMDAVRNQLAEAQRGAAAGDQAAAGGATDTDTAKEGSSAADAKEGGPSKKGSHGGRAKGGDGASKRSSDEEEPSSAKPEKAAGPSESPGSQPKKKGNDELDDLLGGAASAPKKTAPSGGGSKPAAAPSGGGGGGGGDVKANLDRNDVQNGMNSVASAVARCGQGQSGTVTLQVVIGSTGRVVSANATGSFAGTPVGACAARAVRAAKFPKSQNNLTVKYPFKL